jgi:uncharacterized protein YdeI (YjbR/CyaY-like superfamily)
MSKNTFLKKEIAAGVAGKQVHKVPTDFRKALFADKVALAVWEDITPLAQNEWICWVTSAKKSETRDRRIKVGLDKMRKGTRRPCCWGGCIHRSKQSESAGGAKRN